MQEIFDYTKTPSELELLEFFESEPVELVRNDGFWCYEHKDSRGVLARVSCNALAKSVQTDLIVDGHGVVSVVHECAEEIKIEDDLLLCLFSQKQMTRLEVRIRPCVAIKWSSLRIC